MKRNYCLSLVLLAKILNVSSAIHLKTADNAKQSSQSTI